MRDPTIEQKKALVRMMAQMGIDAVGLGLPGASVRVHDESVERLLGHANQQDTLSDEEIHAFLR